MCVLLALLMYVVDFWCDVPLSLQRKLPAVTPVAAAAAAPADEPAAITSSNNPPALSLNILFMQHAYCCTV
jgi:hypothetical protein